MPTEVSVRLRYLHQDKGKKICELLKMKQFSLYSKSNVYLHAKLPIRSAHNDLRDNNKGRPRLLTERDQRSIVRAIGSLREAEGSFSVKRLRLEAGIDKRISDCTVRRCLNELGYKYLQSRRKGLMSRKDIKIRLRYARKVKRLLPNDFWTNGISFYLDGTSFTHKRNPCDQAKSRRSMVWRKKCEGLKLGCTCKGKKAGTGGRMAHFIVAIAYRKGVMLCEQYQERFTGKCYAEFVRKHFPRAFAESANPRGKLFLQDGDPRQNSAAAKRALDDVDAKLFSIPPRSPDINPIENLFHLIQSKLDRDALERNITNENFERFSERVKETMENYPVDTIDKIIDSMDRRISEIIKCKGQRLKY